MIAPINKDYKIVVAPSMATKKENWRRYISGSRIKKYVLGSFKAQLDYKEYLNGKLYELEPEPSTMVKAIMKDGNDAEPYLLKLLNQVWGTHLGTNFHLNSDTFINEKVGIAGTIDAIMLDEYDNNRIAEFKYSKSPVTIDAGKYQLFYYMYEYCKMYELETCYGHLLYLKDHDGPKKPYSQLTVEDINIENFFITNGKMNTRENQAILDKILQGIEDFKKLEVDKVLDFDLDLKVLNYINHKKDLKFVKDRAKKIEENLKDIEKDFPTGYFTGSTFKVAKYNTTSIRKATEMKISVRKHFEIIESEKK